jgi:hypothetical protein
MGRISKRGIQWSDYFSAWRLQQIEPYLDLVLDEIERLAGRPIQFPPIVTPMTQRDVEEAQREGAFGTGEYIPPNGVATVKLHPGLSAWETLVTYTHENLHHAFPEKSEAEIDDLTDIVMNRVFGRR